MLTHILKNILRNGKNLWKKRKSRNPFQELFVMQTGSCPLHCHFSKRYQKDIRKTSVAVPHNEQGVSKTLKDIKICNSTVKVNVFGAEYTQNYSQFAPRGK